jgi:hypothetical protein
LRHVIERIADHPVGLRIEADQLRRPDQTVDCSGSFTAGTGRRGGI